MRCEFVGVWSELWPEVWTPLFAEESVPVDIFSELYRELVLVRRSPSITEAVTASLNDAIQLRESFNEAITLAGKKFDQKQCDELFQHSGAENFNEANQRLSAMEIEISTLTGDLAKAKAVVFQALQKIAQDPKKRAEASERSLEIIINDKEKSKLAFEKAATFALAGENRILIFLENTFEIFQDMGGDGLSNQYFNLLHNFIVKYSLRYDLRRPCLLCPTLPGVFTNLIRDIKAAVSKDAHLNGLMNDLEDAIRDLRNGCSDTRIRTCMAKQINLMEAMGSRCPGVNANTVGAICEQVKTWPHDSVKDSMKNLYKFTCDYPGIRHGGTPATALRAIEMRDMVAMSILLTGFIPYLTDLLDANLVYRGA